MNHGSFGGTIHFELLSVLFFLLLSRPVYLCFLLQLSLSLSLMLIENILILWYVYKHSCRPFFSHPLFLSLSLPSVTLILNVVLQEFEAVQWFRVIAPPLLNGIVANQLAPFVGMYPFVSTHFSAEFFSTVLHTLLKIGANAADIVWVENASNGVNGVLRSFPFKKGNKLLYTNLIYGIL